MKKSLALTILCLLFAFQAGAFNKNTGTVGNTVCFVRFADEDASIFEHTIDTYQNLFNGSNTTDNSVYNYFRQASYNQLEWKSSFYPVTTDTKIVSYKTRYERAYYQKYDATLRPSGYNSDTEGEARMQALVREIANYIEKDVTDATDIDMNDDGYIDNLCIIFSGQSELSNKRGILWPQRKDLALPDEKAIYIKGKKLVGYIMVFDEANGYENFEGIALNTGVLCHEMSHSLGTYDLYHASGSLNPVGIWDLMSDNQLVAQNMTAYTKYRYCKWIDEIPEISEAGTYTLNPVGGSSKENIAYKIKPVGSDEYFVVEYRKRKVSTRVFLVRVCLFTESTLPTLEATSTIMALPDSTNSTSSVLTEPSHRMVISQRLSSVPRVEELLLVARLQPSPSIAMARRHLLPSATFLLAEAPSRSISTNLPTTFL